MNRPQLGKVFWIPNYRKVDGNTFEKFQCGEEPRMISSEPRNILQQSESPVSPKLVKILSELFSANFK